MTQGELQSLLSRAPSRKVRGEIRLQLALNSSLDWTKVDESIGVLKILEKHPHLDRNFISLSLGRLYYGKGDGDKAFQAYGRVLKNSVHWFTAQEEMAWVLVASGVYDKAFGVTHSLMQDYFAPYLGSETVYLNALSRLKGCDYFGTSRMISLFKKKFIQRVEVLEELKKEGMTDGVVALMEALGKEDFHLTSLGAMATLVPRSVEGDRILSSYGHTLGSLHREVTSLNNVLKRGIGEGVSRLKDSSKEEALEQDIEKLVTSLERRMKGTRKEIVAIVKKRAGEELDEISRTLQAMHVLEGQWIQKIALTVYGRGGIAPQFQKKLAHSSLTSRKKRGVVVASDSSVQPYALTFPYRGEVWFDELNHYALAKGNSPKSLCRRR